MAVLFLDALGGVRVDRLDESGIPELRTLVCIDDLRYDVRRGARGESMTVAVCLK